MKRLRLLICFLTVAACILVISGCRQKEIALYKPSDGSLIITQADHAEKQPTTASVPVTEVIESETLTEEPDTQVITEVVPETENIPETEEVVAPSVSTKTFEIGQTWYVAANKLNIRAYTSTDSEIVGSLVLGEEVSIIQVHDGWVGINSAAGPGFVHTDYLVATFEETGLTKSSSSSSETTTPQTSAAPETTQAVSQTQAAPETTVAAAPSTGNGHIVCIDAGHQRAAISEKEPNGPGSTVMKAKLTTGTQGCATGLAEHQLNLIVSLALKQELINRGYQVVMIRETDDCPASNAERAQIANASGAEIFVRIHANSSTNPDVAGAIFYSPSAANPYMNANLIQASYNLSAIMLNEFCVATGAQNRGVLTDDGMTGINWCTIPVTIAEMGFMSNPTEDMLMADPAYQAKMVAGMANGIDAYFGLR